MRTQTELNLPSKILVAVLLVLLTGLLVAGAIIVMDWFVQLKFVTEFVRGVGYGSDNGASVAQSIWYGILESLDDYEIFGLGGG